ncbi:hypothetical protein SHIRM173S_11750 [Streptomyces hirsutus]
MKPLVDGFSTKKSVSTRGFVCLSTLPRASRLSPSYRWEVPTTIEMKSDTWWVGPRPSKSGPSCQIAAMATAGMVRPMLAMSEP